MENIILTALNLNKVCRVCLMECDSMFSIYSELFEDNSDEKIPCIYEILISISSIKVQSDDGLPSMICTKCIDKAHSSYKFQQQCNKSQILLETYIEHINKELAHAEDVSKTIETNQKYGLKSETVESSDSELPPELVLINENDLIKNEVEENECDSLKNCIPLGEDTVDQLIKDNLQVDNLELISPKIRSFNLDLKNEEVRDCSATSNRGKSIKEIPNMNYYKKEKGDKTVEYVCNLCDKSFKYGNSLRIHLKNHSDEKPYMCSECKKSFKIYTSLMHHVRSHSGEQPYECKECGKKYKQSGTLTAHMRIHTGSKPFLCSICGRGFRQAPDLTYHMRTHTKEKPYMCNICGKTMSMQCHLVQHMRSHTGEKPFQCPKCDKAFPSSTRLKRHSITHTTLKPFKCHICDKCFNRNSSLRVHTKTHLGVRSHACSICNKAFLWAHSLRGHMLTHSKESGEKNAQVGSTNVSSPTSTVSAPGKEVSNVKFNTMTIYADSSLDKSTNDSFAIYSSGNGNRTASETFQIYSVGNSEDTDRVETFTLYSAESNADEASGIHSSMVHLSAVKL
ncbi:zinc finger protein 846-like isoform X1 [Anoplophora glabripennis]|uniref:zinc finger protein 846-like isoform X1 n=2 Tax=Anoplophora glabripennis TaxID=217634 RepID=UPI000873AF40|nr:zinc finger protein 846-like isoform X1 [Anoplophora glabripennis]